MSRNIFNSIMAMKPKRNHFDLSYDRKFSCNMGELVPCHVQEVVPGDVIKLKTQQMLRLAPMIAPAMHKIDVYTHYFFVPNRLLWPNWEKFITGNDGNPSPEAPYMTVSGCAVSSIADYMGIPTGDYGSNMNVSVLPFLAYAKIWNEYYRDQNLQEPIVDTAIDGLNSMDEDVDYQNDRPLKRAWQHDYFTSALPFAQKGDAVTIPLGTTADVMYKEPGTTVSGTVIRNAAGGAIINDMADGPITTGSVGPPDFGGLEIGGVPVEIDNSQNLEVNLSEATASTINDLRRAFRLQEWLEKNARGGSRYIESILSHFGVKSSDSRLQRPEYLGGGKSPVVISEVLQTSESVTTPQGNLAGHGINVGTSHSFSRHFEEHGYIIGIMSVMPQPAYQQGVHRHWTRFDKLDYLWPTFAHIGEQEIKNKELYVFGTDEDREGVFGYTPRYAEYRYLPPTVHGDFTETLRYWHMGRYFETRPSLNEDFIKCDPTKGIFAVQDLPDDGDPENPVRNFDVMYCHMYHQIHAKRPLPKWGIPTF